ncbi:MAG: MaoC family dehydratase [Dehalococcoidales bacterium]|nr:MAG: MaoC family dehydratase [Dehalococcoidales bacterium]
MAVITQDTKEGESFSGKSKKVSWERIWAFSGGPFTFEGWPKKNIHTDIDYARACGLPDNKVAASATQFQGYLVQLMIDLFGIEWLSRGTMDVKFIRIVNAGDIITASAAVISKEKNEHSTLFTMNVDCENQDGEKVLVGTATGGVGEYVSDILQTYNERLIEIKDNCTRLAQPGDVSPEPLEYVVTPELNHQFLYAEEDFSSYYLEEINGGDAIVHPALILNWSNDTRSPSFKAASMQSGEDMWAPIHTRDETFFINPVRVGKRLKVTWDPIGSYEKRRRLYSVIDILVTDEDGLEIIRRLYYTILVSPIHKL